MNQEKTTVRYTKLSDITNEIYQTLPVMEVELIRNYNKRINVTRYSMNFKLGYLPIIEQLKPEKYFHILTVKNNVEAPDVYKIKVKYRFIKGTDKNGQEFKQVQFVFAKDCYLTHLLSKQQINLIDTWEKKGLISEISYVEKPDGIDDEFIEEPTSLE